MPYSRQTIAQAKQDAYAAEGLAVLASNGLSDSVGTGVPAFFNTGGTDSSPDLSSPSFPPEAMHDYAMDSNARAVGSASIWYVNVTFGPSINIDSLALKIDSLNASQVVVNFQVADDAAFTTNLATIWTATLTNTNRLVQHGLNYIEGAVTTEDQVYNDVNYARIQFVLTAGVVPPYISELWLGESLQFSRYLLPPHDDNPQSADYVEHIAVNRNVKRYVHALGYFELSASMNFVGDNQDNFGLDDLATLRSLRTETQVGTRPVWWRDRAGLWHLVVITSDMQAVLGAGSYRLRVWDFSVSELPPFQSQEV